MPVARRLHRTWQYLLNRNLQGGDSNRRLQALYALPDPWQLDSAAEQARFAWVNGLLAGLPARPARLLEIGCGEGHQSRWLARACETLVGVDVSALATERAGKALPGARFCTTAWLDAEGQRRLLGEQGPFDLVVACEVLYYLSDVPAALAALERLGRTVLVTSYAGKARHVIPQARAHVGASLAEASFTHLDDGSTWLAAWWSPGSARP